jgi:DNA invertase Pin-like site-specific DNA recombinase
MERGDPNTVRAAQYIRMSREHQRYSPANQAAAIAEFASARGYEIVRTYQDNGRSGLTLKGRPALTELLTAVISGQADFSAVLVLDVSRWGRFQDPDQAAHYEFLCREAGVSIQYCGEPFANDGSSMTSLMKHMKRVMAGEYSRELGVRIWTAQVRVARSGYKLGGAAPFGLRRLLIDENGRAIRELRTGERKAVQSERVVLVHGPEAELTVVRNIFRWFAREDSTFVSIAERLAKQGVLSSDGDAFSVDRIAKLVRNPIYQGIYTFNKSTQRLKRGVSRNPPEQWIQYRMLKPIVSPSLFSAAQRRLGEPRRKYTRPQLLRHLRKIAKSGSPLASPK